MTETESAIRRTHGRALESEGNGGDASTAASLRFFVGPHEIGDFTLCLTKGLRELGHDVSNVVKEPKPGSPSRAWFDQRDYDRSIPWRQLPTYRQLQLRRRVRQFQLSRELARQIATKRDVYVFNSASCFSVRSFHQSRYRDLRVLRRLGKKVVFVLQGSEVRSPRVLAAELDRSGHREHSSYVRSEVVPALGDRDQDRRETARALERYADHVFARPDHAQFLTRAYHLAWFPIDLRTTPFELSSNRVPLVVHAPSRRDLKGTRFVLQAVDRLRSEGHRFEFRLCEEMSNVDLRALLTTADVVVDQLLLPAYGLLALEGLATGNAVIGSAIPKYDGYPEELPIVTSTPSNVYQNLKRVLVDVGLRKELAVRGRQYVKRYHDHVTVARDFVRKITEDNP